MSGSAGLRLHVVSDNAELTERVRAAGAELVPLAEAEALVWNGSRTAFPSPLPASVGWVQLPSAGVESWMDAGIFDRDRVWTSAAGAYAETCAEHALTLLLAGVRGVPTAVVQPDWQRAVVEPHVGGLGGSRVLIVGAGGIGRALARMLVPLNVEVLAINRSGRAVPGAARTIRADATAAVDAAWEAADHVVVAAPATPETRHLVGAKQLARLGPRSWVVNVARGSLIDSDALVRALADGAIGGAALDVTDPEPLPADHPLWSQPRAIITPHVANPPAALRPAFAAFVADNVARRIAGRELRGVIDLDAGY